MFHLQVVDVRHLGGLALKNAQGSGQIDRVAGSGGEEIPKT